MHEKDSSDTRASPRSASLDDSSSEKKHAPAEVRLEPVIAARAAAEEEERELDPVALNKSFRLAAWSSVILVRLRVSSPSS